MDERYVLILANEWNVELAVNVFAAVLAAGADRTGLIVDALEGISAIAAADGEAHFAAWRLKERALALKARGSRNVAVAIILLKQHNIAGSNRSVTDIRLVLAVRTAEPQGPIIGQVDAQRR